jgi:predicted flap endonuclease-1-like 5' DNA nuclease
MTDESEAAQLPKAIGRVATRELKSAGYLRLEDVAGVSEKELLRIHGVGPKATRILKEALVENGLEPMKP